MRFPHSFLLHFTIAVRHWLGRSLPLVLLIALLLSGCRSLIAETKASSLSQIVLTSLQDPATFNPMLNQEFPSIFLFSFRGLTTEDGETGEVKPDLAESWEISEDGRRVVFTLREGLRWSDGEPLTADDVVFTIQDVILNEKIPTDNKDDLRIGANGEFPQVQKLSDRQVEFLLPEPYAPLLRALNGPPTGVVILPKHTLQGSVETLDSQGNSLFTSTWATNTDPTKVVVNGPYKMERYTPGERLTFERNPYYWEKDAAGQQLPYIDRIVWQFMESTDTQLLSFRSGDLDAIGDVRPLRPEYFELLKREEERGKFTVYTGGEWSGTTFITFNLNRGKNAQGQPLVDPIKSRWFNTLEFRQAIAHAINRPRMINNIFRGISKPQDSPISVQSPYYLSPEQGLKVYDYDLDKARQLLQSIGFSFNAEGQLFDADGNRVRFSFLTNSGNEIREAIGSQIRADLAQIGIQVDFRPISFNTLITRVTTTRDWECFMIGFTGGIDPHSGANLWTSKGGSHMFNLGPQPGEPQITGWQPNDWELEIDRLFTAGARELDESKRQEIYGNFQRIVQEQLPVIHLIHEIALVAVRDRIQGLKYTGLPSWGLWNIQELKVVDERDER
ncbi:ABC transporter substrate-binding protein [Leptolyngbya sp. FACHB-671]|uniref:ABC transporter substrate-binding protein n=1 Tax=Leptolyngbya sp. FACHB-671 TaxID=2692812 RepID=UPI0016884704|nr:ABC transporter substrate-binding protein [Leptolyngbya sp. FACHB-671]MBD2070412.1 ABC transporter substrate-binding protein [Leptolyngbya sp. FACHB-671]